MKAMRIFLMLSVLIPSFAFCSWENGAHAPDELYGVWETANSRYDDCLIEFRKHFIVFESGLNHRDINYIHQIKKKQETNRILYTIRYENEEGTEFDFEFYYYPSRKGAILLFKNQADVRWSKKTQS